MRTVGMFLLATSICAGCSVQKADQQSFGEAETHGAVAAGVAGSVSPRRLGSSFAALPDRGELVAYSRGQLPRTRGAYTWHAVQLSEAHALRAIATGNMAVVAPNGSTIHLRYQRHVEHANGNWTWIGRDERGVDAILTFGEKAAFGSMPYGDEEALRLTTFAGRAWLMETDRRKIAMLDTPATRPRKPDYLLPPHRNSSAGVDAGLTAAASGKQAAAVASAPTVDVMIGYTPGFAAMVGGTSQALTRLDYLTDVTNLTYANSNVAGQVRLVHALQVSYPDNTANAAALNALTGLDGMGGTAPTPAALMPLRNAREQYGADLVSLVRRFNDPENEGCGIAWLVGGGQSSFNSSDAPYGYSVVSDSQGNLSPDGGYVCRDETLAHELGHNMGSQHDVATAKGDNGALDANEYGRYAYSFGHKTGAGTGNFYTVMAYGDDGQMKWRVFSNPDITYCGGFSCGVANQSDNARSLRQTMPIVATFRAGVLGLFTTTPSDFDGDGVSDLVWRNKASGGDAIWLSADASRRHPFDSVPHQQWRVVATGDFDGDGSADIFWRNFVTGSSAIWRSANSSNVVAVSPVTDFNWNVVGSGDFDGDGKADLLWRNEKSGANSLWISANAAVRISLAVVPGSDWRVAGIGDFDGNGMDDILWHNSATRVSTIWNSANSADRSAVATIPRGGWNVAGIGDFGGDGQSDILWRNFTTGENVVWDSGVSTSSRSVARVSNLDWKVAKIGDFDGDGTSDIVWRNARSGVNSLWKAGVSANEQALTDVVDTAWMIVP